jgi:hypothetical protein
MNIHNVRLLIGDNDSTDYVLRDVDIAFFLEEAAQNAYLAAAMAAEAIAAKYARLVTNSQSDVHGNHSLTRNYSDRHKHYMDLAKRLEKRRTSSVLEKMSLGGVYAGGISKADKETRQENDDRPETAFARDLHENVRGTQRGSILE